MDITEYEERPWGNFRILDENKFFKVKRIEVSPGARLSYQKHKHRAEHWFIVAGVTKVTLDDEITVETGKAIDIPLGASRGEHGRGKTCVYRSAARQVLWRGRYYPIAG